jgi:hypothetical protein
MTPSSQAPKRLSLMRLRTTSSELGTAATLTCPRFRSVPDISEFWPIERMTLKFRFALDADHGCFKAYCRRDGWSHVTECFSQRDVQTSVSRRTFLSLLLSLDHECEMWCGIVTAGKVGDESKSAKLSLKATPKDSGRECNRVISTTTPSPTSRSFAVADIFRVFCLVFYC